MIRGQIRILIALLFSFGCGTENNRGVTQPSEAEDVGSHDMDFDSDHDLATDPIICKFDEETQRCTPGCRGIRAKGWYASVAEDGECAVEFTDEEIMFCHWWTDFIDPDDRSWTGHLTVSYRYLENGELEAVFMDSPMNPRVGHGFINEWIACADTTVTNHPTICEVCYAVPECTPYYPSTCP